MKIFGMTIEKLGAGIKKSAIWFRLTVLKKYSYHVKIISTFCMGKRKLFKFADGYYYVT
jgi:hypothetical protein